MSRTYHKKKLDGVTRNLEEELENKTVDENVINPEEPEIKKKGFFKKLFGK